MKRLWRFLSERRNREVLGWIGAGLVVLASGIWAVTIYRFPPHGAQDSKPTAVEARCGSVAVGGSVTASTLKGGSSTGTDCSTKTE